MTTQKNPAKPTKVSKPKQDKKAIKLLKKIDTLFGRFIKRVGKSSARNTRVKNAATLRAQLGMMLKDEKAGWVDLKKKVKKSK